ncbi:MAG: AraC family transcriptional regulator [Acetobacteraceae bacterium]
MYSSDTEMMMPPANPGISVRASAKPSGYIIWHERTWRSKPATSGAPSLAPRVLATRWVAREAEAREVAAETPPDCHIVKIILRSMNCRLTVAGRIIHNGTACPGMVHVTEPGADSRCLFRGPYDTLHLHVPNGLIEECGREIAIPTTATLHSADTMTRDRMIDELGRALLAAEEVGDPYRSLYAERVSLAIVARLLTFADRVPERAKRPGLANWRLRRAVEYIDAHLSQPVTLADIASAAGLSRMHFAAQFKSATGLRPHEYLLRRRVERAQEALLSDGASVVDVALSVGFQSQPHFTTIFRRIVGQPPHAWRLSNGCRFQDTGFVAP